MNFVKVSSGIFDMLVHTFLMIPAILMMGMLIAFTFGFIGAATVWFFNMFSKGFL